MSFAEQIKLPDQQLYIGTSIEPFLKRRFQEIERKWSLMMLKKFT